jgi:hypothetical protein
MRSYFGAFYYLPTDSSINSKDIPSIKDKNADLSIFNRENEQYSYFWGANIAWQGETLNSHPKSKMDDGFSDVIVKLF